MGSGLGKQQVTRKQHNSSYVSGFFAGMCPQSEIVREYGQKPAAASTGQGNISRVHACAQEELSGNILSTNAVAEGLSSMHEPGHAQKSLGRQCVYSERVARSFGINRREV
jgi:hypothetical protein